MSQIYNIYCDESCHLENDKQKAMVLGAVWCPADEAQNIFKRIREIKEIHGINKFAEIKWSKISPSKHLFYQNLIDYFFDNTDLHFRCLVIPDKNKLNHEVYKQTHDQWYYKMYFDMIKTIISPDEQYNIYIDIKDTKGEEKKKKLHEVLCNNQYDFDRSIIKKIQLVRSHEIELQQLADLLIGAVSYFHRELKDSETKIKLIKRIKEKSGYGLDRSTFFKEEKFNIFIWDATEKLCSD